MENYFKEINNFIIEINIKNYPEEIRDKVKYFLQDGKRLRPILCLLFSGIEIKQNEKTELNESNSIIYTIASCIEQIHCLSLVLDDLPEMDNDSIRRGKQSFHSKYGISYTNFFVYYIFNHIGLSLDIILEKHIDNNIDNNDIDNNDIDNNYEISSRINKLIVENLNMLIDGQYNDLFYNMSKINTSLDSNIDSNINNELKTSLFHNEKKIILNLINIDIDIDIDNDIKARLLQNIELNMKKTISLFNLSICTGFLLQIWLNKYKSNIEIIDKIYNKLNNWSNILGYMFQISDDILDIDDDKEKGRPNLCNIIGKAKTCELLKKGCEWLKDMISGIYDKNNIELDNSLNINLDIVNEIIEKILKRSKI